MENLDTLLERLTGHLESYNSTDKANDARKIGECICKVILASSAKTISLSGETKFDSLIQSLSNTNFSENISHIKKIRLELSNIQTLTNIDSHDNPVGLTPEDNVKIKASLTSIFKDCFDAKEHFDIDAKIPAAIYAFIGKFIQEQENWRGSEIISLVYPNRNQTKLSKENDFEFYKLNELSNQVLGFVFLGRNISFSKAVNALFTNYRNDILSMSNITVIFPKEISKHTGKEIKDRKKNIEQKFEGHIEKIKNKFSFDFIEDYIWEHCLPNTFKSASNITKEPYFVDQWLYNHDKQNSNKILSLEFIRNLLNNKNTGDKPISVIIGDGGIGKTTFCTQAIDMVDSELANGKKKRAFLLSSVDLPDELSNSGSQVNSIYGLYTLLKEDDETALTSQNLALNISSGNVLIIIDGIDEIESKLKERFNLNTFLESVIQMNDTYQNCNVILTTRQKDLSLYDKSNIEVYQLTGFNKGLIESYLKIRYKGNQLSNQAKIKEYIEKLNLKSSDTGGITPLVLNLICDFVETESDKQQDNFYTPKYFKFENPLDKVVFQIIQREIIKHDLRISVDTYFELLKDIIFDYNSNISKIDLAELISFNLSPGNQASENIDESFYISPLLKQNGEDYKLKHDSLESWIKARFFAYLINTSEPSIIENSFKILEKECYRGGVLTSEILKFLDSQYFDKLSALLKYVIEKKNSETASTRKIISAILYLSISNSSRDENTSNLLSLFKKQTGEQLNFLSIYGNFIPLDFTKFTVKNGFFSGYNCLSKSNFPKNKVVFMDCEFKDIDTTAFKKDSLSTEHFEGCKMPETVRHVIHQNESTRSNQVDAVKHDLKKILKVGFKSSAFIWKSEPLYRQQCATLRCGISLQKLLEKLTETTFLVKEPEKNSSQTGYRVELNKQNMVSKYLTQGICTPEIDKLITELMS